MVTEPLDLRHKELLFERFKNIGSPISEYSFSNSYLFRHVHRYEVVQDREVFLKGITYDGHSYLMPTVALKHIDLGYLKELMQTVDFLFPVPPDWIEDLGDNLFETTFKKGDMDYLFTVEKMSTLKGRNLHNKRNLLRRFLEAYKHEALPLTKERVQDALFVLEQWQAESGLDTQHTDYGPCREALQLYDDLVLCGGMYYADGEPAGFVIGEELHNDTFVLHFAKAQKKFRGVYQYMFNNFARILPEKYTYLNLEQDLDKETLRIAKGSYQPDLMLKKMRVALKKD